MIREAEDRHAWDEKYAGSGEVSEWIARVHGVADLKIAAVLRRLVSASSSILEAGSGTGRIITFLALRTGARGFGVDYAIEANRLAGETASALNLPRRFVSGDLERLPFGDLTFDVVFSDSVIEHLADPEGAVMEMGRVARPGGFVVVSVPNRLRPDGWDLYRCLRRPAYRQRSFTPWGLAAMCRRADLTVVEVFGDTLVLMRNFRTRPGSPGKGTATSAEGRSRQATGRGRLRRIERLAERIVPPYLWVNVGVVCRKG